MVCMLTENALGKKYQNLQLRQFKNLTVRISPASKGYFRLYKAKKENF